MSTVAIPLETAPSITKDPQAVMIRTLDFLDFLRTADPVEIIGASNTSPIVLTLKSTPPVIFSDGQAVWVEGVEGNTTANGPRYVKFVTSLTYSLYSDALLTVPVAGNGFYIQGGRVGKIDTITTAPWTVSAGLTKDSESKTATTSTVTVSGGNSGQSYTALCHITTAGGQQDDRTLRFQVRNL